MKTVNLISSYQGAAALEEVPSIEKKFKTLKPHEIRNLRSFCDEMLALGCNLNDLDGFYSNYSINQIGKEFDLLRFSDKCVINIELKSELKIANKSQKILEQMKINYYYLKFLGREIKIFTVVENDGCYEYIPSSNSLNNVSASTIAHSIKSQVVDYSIDPDKEFIPSNYLVSPFNSSKKFLNGEYFLTSSQQRIKSEVQTTLAKYQFAYFCLSANAGTGKTLLLYDLAKEMLSHGKRILIIHCGKLNEGHIRLRDTYGWNIIPIKNISEVSASTYLENCSMVFIDEAQRIRFSQLSFILDASNKQRVPLVFSYDTKQFLRSNEGLDLSDYLKSHCPSIHTVPLRLTNKIRTNKEMASFITNLLHIGKSADHLNYECVTIDYIDNLPDLDKYLQFLKESGWTALTYTTSQYSPDPYNELICVSDQNAHDVIGQEFPKVVFVMNKNFYYDSSGNLVAGYSYYSSKGMLYQIVTRVIEELKIVVFQNPELYYKLLEIKSMGS